MMYVQPIRSPNEEVLGLEKLASSNHRIRPGRNSNLSSPAFWQVRKRPGYTFWRIWLGYHGSSHFLMKVPSPTYPDSCRSFSSIEVRSDNLDTYSNESPILKFSFIGELKRLLEGSYFTVDCCWVWR